MHYKIHYVAMLAILLCSACTASKEMVAEKQVLQSSLDECQSQLSSTQQQLAQLQNQSGSSQTQLAQLQTENTSLRNQLTETQTQLTAMTTQMQEGSDDYGIWFRVQIGAYEEREIDKSLETTDQLNLENRDDIQKITLGRFRSYNDAKQLQGQLQAMGLKDAWVVSYRDGQRVPIESVLNK